MTNTNTAARNELIRQLPTSSAIEFGAWCASRAEALAVRTGCNPGSPERLAASEVLAARQHDSTSVGTVHDRIVIAADAALAALDATDPAYQRALTEGQSQELSAQIAMLRSIVGGQTLAQASQLPTEWPDVPAHIEIVSNHPCSRDEYGWECTRCGGTSEHYHAPQIEAWRSAAMHRCTQPSGGDPGADGQTLAQASQLPPELEGLPYRLHALSRAAPEYTREHEYVTDYLTPGRDYDPGWLDEQLAAMRAALPAGWMATWLSTDPGDTRIVVWRPYVEQPPTQLTVRMSLPGTTSEVTVTGERAAVFATVSRVHGCAVVVRRNPQTDDGLPWLVVDADQARDYPAYLAEVVEDEVDPGTRVSGARSDSEGALDLQPAT